MFIQSGNNYINTSNINYINVNEKTLKVFIYFEASVQGSAHDTLVIKCEDINELDELVRKLTN